MSISPSRTDLFRTPATADKLTLFRDLLDTDALTADLTLALLKVIHRELSIHQNHDRSVYKRYAEAIELLRYHMADMLQDVVTKWDSRGITAPMEWFSQKDR
jgi:hypothetical protein